MTLSRKEAAALLGISISTLQRRTKAGQYHATKTGEGQFAEVTYTHTGIGLPEPRDIVIDANYEQADETPEPAATVAPEPEPSAIDVKAEQDRQFAAAYLSGEATDSNGNDCHGTNKKFPVSGATSLIGPQRPPEPQKPRSGTDHMDQRLLSDWPDPTGPRPALNRVQCGEGFSRHRDRLAAGYTQEQYDGDMRRWRRSGGGRSQGDMERAARRSVETINAAFPKADRT